MMHVRQHADGALRILVLMWIVSGDPLCGRHFEERQSGFLVTRSVSLGKSVTWLWVLIGVCLGKVGFYCEHLRPHTVSANFVAHHLAHNYFLNVATAVPFISSLSRCQRMVTKCHH